jgi:hypothetical protein
MTNVRHKPIKRFELEGTIYDDSHIYRLKNEYIRLVTIEMRISGYVPRIDIAPDFNIEYNEKTQSFNFKLLVYAIYVGKRKSEWIFGVNVTSIVPIQPSKSKEFLPEVE